MSDDNNEFGVAPNVEPKKEEFEAVNTIRPHETVIEAEPLDDVPEFTELVQEFETPNGYTFGIVLLSDEDGELYVETTFDNCVLTFPLEDFIAMATNIAAVMPSLAQAHQSSRK